MKILGTGLSGMVGSRIVDLLSPQWSFENLSLETGIDITNPKTVHTHISQTDASWVFHFAAYTDVDGAENEKGENGNVWKCNVTATKYFVEECKKTGKHLLYISTDFVFDGRKDEYNEDDQPNPLGWYAKTKYEGEKRVLQLGENGLVIRIAYPYRPNPIGKKDFVHKIVDKLSASVPFNAPSNQQIIPTYVDDIGEAIKVLVLRKASGIFHVVGSQVLTPYEIAIRIARAYNLKQEIIKPTTFKEYFAGKSIRPFRAVLKNDKIAKLGIRMHTFDEGLALMQRQEQAQVNTV